MSSGEFPQDEIDSLSAQDKLLGVCLSFLGFSVCFVVSWILFTKFHPKFAVMTSALKADNCSRVNSTIHSIVVVPALIIGILQMDWGPHVEPLDSVEYLQKVLCFTVGYFACDTVIILMYQVPLWGVFAVHHVVASMPYVTYMFISACPFGLFILSCFMLVELSNISLNAQVFLEQNGLGDSRWYAAAFYTTFVGWIFCRIINPVSMIFVLHLKLIPGLTPVGKRCLIPGAICAYLICIFCIGVFIFVLCKEVRQRWAESPNPREVAPLQPPQFNTTSVPMTDEERELTIESPTRIFIQEARETFRELEHAVSAEFDRHRPLSLLSTLENRSVRVATAQATKDTSLSE